MEVCGAVTLAGYSDFGCFGRNVVGPLVGHVLLVSAEPTVTMVFIRTAIRLRYGRRMAL
jgi:hypothetical protein